jgi:hypothetical protein
MKYEPRYGLTPSLITRAALSTRGAQKQILINSP